MESTGGGSEAKPNQLLSNDNGRSHRVGNPPNRVEPRAINRRPKPHDPLNTPRKPAPTSSPVESRNSRHPKRQ